MHEMSENTLFHMKRAIGMLDRTQHLPDSHDQWVQELIRLTAFNENALKCGGCGKVNLPLTQVKDKDGNDNGLSCVFCYANMLIDFNRKGE